MLEAGLESAHFGLTPLCELMEGAEVVSSGYEETVDWACPVISIGAHCWVFLVVWALENLGYVYVYEGSLF